MDCVDYLELDDLELLGHAYGYLDLHMNLPICWPEPIENYDSSIGAGFLCRERKHIAYFQADYERDMAARVKRESPWEVAISGLVGDAIRYFYHRCCKGDCLKRFWSNRLDLFRCPLGGVYCSNLCLSAISERRALYIEAGFVTLLGTSNAVS